MLYCSTDAAFAHELEGLRTWQRVEGANFKADRRLTLVSVASGGEGAGPLTQGPGSPGLFSPPEARLQMASGEARAAVRQAGRFEPLGDLCPSGSFRDERTGRFWGADTPTRPHPHTHTSGTLATHHDHHTRTHQSHTHLYLCPYISVSTRYLPGVERLPPSLSLARAFLILPTSPFFDALRTSRIKTNNDK